MNDPRWPNGYDEDDEDTQDVDDEEPEVRPSSIESTTP